MKLTPLADRVILKMVEVEETTKGGIILTASAKEKPSVAEVISVGPGGTVDGKTVTMTLGSAVMTVGDKVVTMDTAAYATAEGRTVVPVRFAAEALGFNVEAVYATDGTTSAVNFSK